MYVDHRIQFGSTLCRNGVEWHAYYYYYSGTITRNSYRCRIGQQIFRKFVSTCKLCVAIYIDTLILCTYYQDEDSAEDCEAYEYVDDLLLLEIRKRDFGQNASSCAASSASGSWTDREQENDYECDSLCTESESSGMKQSDGWFDDSESDINQETEEGLVVYDEESQDKNTETGYDVHGCNYKPGLVPSTILVC